ncbi:ABC transporter permease [Thermofilum pendens]|uniref:Binding-protein-dependent transport systems inner membrane component n=1 Tax=Thermofilum pendens (strain DSM 2475 / Hrk 5) TaxID=368408 RepID=A1S0U2_THEPD|nr:ABC transporter permease [Thermofilum pendens]ABL79072.1 binding-protein-dependent transport systems inner membrane component [Thermofilum pendens Hrk 5]
MTSKILQGHRVNSGLLNYFLKRLFILLLSFFLIVTINWLIPRMAPGNPVDVLISRMGLTGLQASAEQMRSYFLKAFALDKPLWEQYINFWLGLFQGDLGISVYRFPTPVSEIIMEAIPYTVAPVAPALLVSWYIGNKLGALAAKKRLLDNILVPLAYYLANAPYFWLGVVLQFVFSVELCKSTPICLPSGFPYSRGLTPSLNVTFLWDAFMHWILPFASYVLVQMGGWMIGMRNMIIYELGSNYAKYMEDLGFSDSMLSKYVYRHALLPQVTGLGIQIGMLVSLGVAVEFVFSYPGLGYYLVNAIQNRDYFLTQGIVLVVTISVLVANFIIDILYGVLDPRTRLTEQ